MKLCFRAFNITVTAVLAALILTSAALAFSTRLSRDQIPTLFGRKVLTVLSGSMEPAIHTGDVIVIKPIEAGEAIAEGDIVTFRSREKSDVLITHRVIGLVSVNGSPKAYVTKGDANDTKDLTAVSADQVIGRYGWRVPYFGYVSGVLRQPLGIILGVVLPGLILIASELRKIWRVLSENEAGPVPKAKESNTQGGDQPEST